MARELGLMNLKGGSSKTVSAVNIAWELAAAHGKRVLLVDLDPQGHSSRFFGARSYDAPGVAEVLTQRKFDVHRAIVRPALCAKREVDLDVLQANLSLLRANKEILMDCTRPQQVRLRQALDAVQGDYDFVVMDFAPSLDMATINGLVACKDVLVPVTMDDFALDGLDLLTEQIDQLRDGYAPRLRLAGCLVTNWRPTMISAAALDTLLQSGLPVFSTKIRATCRVPESLTVRKPLRAYKPKSTAALDYAALTEEYLQMVSNLDTRGGCKHGEV